MSDYVMVPREPTLDMISAGNRVGAWVEAPKVYAAMLAAAPPPPASQDEDMQMRLTMAQLITSELKAIGLGLSRKEAADIACAVLAILAPHYEAKGREQAAKIMEKWSAYPGYSSDAAAAIRASKEPTP